eukprot:Nk52_evm78s217 gene=Nk52_evmTU78s217
MVTVNIHPDPSRVDMEAIERSAPTSENKGMVVSFHKLSYSVEVRTELSAFEKMKQMRLSSPREEKAILKDITGSIKPGCLTALMGPSGAGKSTLLDVIAGRKNTGNITGTIKYDGQDAPRNFKQITSYVQQMDVLMPTLKVRELLYYTAELKLPPSFTTEMKKERVEQVIAELGLEGCADTIIGDRLHRGISGGQAKRVNIGMELVTDPCVLFLDEPTTGLDSTTALDVMNVVRKLTDNGRSVICTIHQPSTEIFNMFDRLLLLVLGEVVYEGERSKAVPYFTKFGYNIPKGMNPSDYIMDIVGEDMEDGERLVPGEVREPSFFVDEYKKSELAQSRLISAKAGLLASDDKGKGELNNDQEKTEKEALSKKESVFINSFWHEFSILSRRGVRGKMRDATYIMNGILKNLILGIIFMTIYVQSSYTATGMSDRWNLLFLVVAVMGFSAFDFLPGLLNERDLFYRERASGTYRVSSYYISCALTGAPFSFVAVLIFALILYYTVAFNPSFEAFLFFIIMSLLLMDLSIALGHACSSFFADLDGSTAFLNVVLTIFIFFSGFGLNPSDVPYYWIWAYWISFMRYAMEGLGQNEFRGRWYGDCNPKSEDLYTQFCRPNDGTFEYSGSAYMDNFEFDINKWICLAIVGGICIFLHIMAYIGTRFVSHASK